MNRITSFLALSAIVVAGAFAGTAAQASANVNVQFKVHNGDASQSMIRTAAPSSGITGLISPAAAILAGGNDPDSGFALLSLPTPALRDYVQGSVSYAKASDGVSNLCTFTITVTRAALNMYTAHFSVASSAGNCSAPGDATNSTGQFTSATYAFVWST